MNAIPNQEILNQVNRSGAWVHARKTKPVWARMAGRRQVIRSPEGEHVAQKGDIICRGIHGERWPQKAGAFQQKYQLAEGEALVNGWRKYLPVPDAAGVMAAQIDRPFEVVALWGKLNGKAGDYLVKRAEDRETAYPEDVWVVDRAIFEASYEVV